MSARSKTGGAALAVTGFLASPCHLPVTLPLLLGVLGGTAIGSFLTANLGPVIAVAGVYHLAALGLAWYLFTRKKSRTGETVQAIKSPVRLAAFGTPPSSLRSPAEPAAKESIILPVAR